DLLCSAMQKVRKDPEPATKGSNGGILPLGAIGSDDLGISLYSTPPNVEVSIREFEDFTKDRLKILHAIDRNCSYDSRLENMPEL
ncbi:unnamed protein product, partial [Polarella glacialis]